MLASQSSVYPYYASLSSSEEVLRTVLVLISAALVMYCNLVRFQLHVCSLTLTGTDTARRVNTERMYTASVSGDRGSALNVALIQTNFQFKSSHHHGSNDQTKS